VNKRWCSGHAVADAMMVRTAKYDPIFANAAIGAADAPAANSVSTLGGTTKSSGRYDQ